MLITRYYKCELYCRKIVNHYIKYNRPYNWTLQLRRSRCSLISFQQLKINRRYSIILPILFIEDYNNITHVRIAIHTENYRYSDFICSKLRLSKYFGTPICSGLTRCLIYPIMVFCDEIRELPRNSD